MEFNIVLVCLENFQNYILTCIDQLLKLGHREIYVITNNHLMSNFEGYSVFLIDADMLDDVFGFAKKTTMDSGFRNGFWKHTSARFFALYSFMEQTGVKNVIHIENDVLLYYNCNETLTFETNKLYIPFDTYERNIASIVYIPDSYIFGKILAHYDFGKNDMYNFGAIREKTDLICTLPIFIDSNSENRERAFVCSGYTKYIFDAAAIGQFLGGVDPRNTPGDSRGFVNETCVIKYCDEGTIVWKVIDGLKKPFIQIGEIVVPIFNLHIHCKNLVLYIS
jgi:hypothetical protein